MARTAARLTKFFRIIVQKSSLGMFDVIRPSDDERQLLEENVLNSYFSRLFTQHRGKIRLRIGKSSVLTR